MMSDHRLSAREQQVLDARLKGLSTRQIAADLGLSRITVNQYARQAAGHLEKWERDPFEDETPREARARVAREIAEGKRCTGRMFNGGPCSLLLPCATHG